MSYILDALRRAEAERERGRVPTLNTQPTLSEQAADERRASHRASPRTWWWAGLGGLALLLLGAGAARWLAAPAAPPPAPVAALEPRMQPTEAAPVAARVPAPVAVQALPSVAPPAPQARPADRQEPAPTQAVVAREAPVAAMPSIASTANTAARPAPVAERAADAPVPALRELPEGLRRELPPLTASGAMYSETAANRLLIVNGQLYHEGDPVAPGVVLEQIKLRSAVLSFRGQRFRLDY